MRKFYLILFFFMLGMTSLMSKPIPILPDSLAATYAVALSQIENQEFEQSFLVLEQLKSADVAKRNVYIQSAGEYLKGKVFARMSLGENAEQHLQQSCILFLETQQKEMLGLCYRDLGDAMEDKLENQQKQLSYYQKSLALYIEQRDTINMIRSCDLLGHTYALSKHFEDALQKGHEAERIMLTNSEKFIDFNVFCNIGTYYYKLGNYKRAIVYAEKCLKNEEINLAKSPSSVYTAYQIIGSSYLKMGRKNEGLKYLHHALDYDKSNKKDSFLSSKAYNSLLEEALNHEAYKEASILQHDYYPWKNSTSSPARRGIAMPPLEKGNISKLKDQAAENANLSAIFGDNYLLNWKNNIIGILGLGLFLSLIFLYLEKRNFNLTLKNEVDKQTKIMSQKNLELERFAHIASHDLRTPLRNIISFSTLIDRKLKKEQYSEVGQFTEFVREYALHMNEIISGIMDFTKIEYIAIKDVDHIDLDKIAAEVVGSLKERIVEKNAVVHIDADLPKIRFNPKHLTQLLQNLLDNALLYNDCPQPTITIGTEINTQDEVNFFIKDNGIGIEPEYQNKVFGMFSRLHTLEKYPGTGLGLAICKKIVDQYGGRIWLDSRHQKGTTVHIALPLAS